MTDNTRVDPRLAFLARAAARLALVEAGEMELEEAYDGLIEFDLRLPALAAGRTMGAHAPAPTEI